MPKKQTGKTKRRTPPASQKLLSKAEQKKVKGGQKLSDSIALANRLHAPGEW